MSFPDVRMRRLRSNPLIRAMVQETRLSTDNLVMPLFVCEGQQVKNPVGSMPGVYRFSIDLLVEECHRIAQMGIRSVLLFGIPGKKGDHVGYDEDGIVQRAVRAIKSSSVQLYVITDVCNCEYSEHGHCGIVVNGAVDNDLSLEILSKQAVSYAKAGCDMIAPSDMMDGRIGAIRKALDANGFAGIPIMSYAAKYASGFYGPFRDAADCAPQFGDRKTYQMNPANVREALREVELDIEEGADIIMVKPALSYLDVIHQVKQQCTIPVAAYNVSGEYSMVKAAAANGWIHEDTVMMEILLSIKRAGADLIITYHAERAAEIIQAGSR
ncbi:MAG TPA: porphobilinogen synthase [Chitinispirillaceae bacterium]|nr:porphobilinogen synthase [Chitinispirillaceae bacterium]